MRRTKLAFLVCVLSVVALGQKETSRGKLTLDQLNTTLSADSNSGDAQLAAKLLALEVTERISQKRLDQWNTALPGGKSKEALRILADLSSWNPPDPADIPEKAVPDSAELRQILINVVNYANSSLHKLPNFIATRGTTTFEDQPKVDVLQSTGIVSYSSEPLHEVRSYRDEVSYRDGHEVLATSGKKRESGTSRHGLETAGEFGPFLSTVLADAVKGKITWARWEQGSNGADAVFHYQVEKNASHYLVQFCCISEDASESFPTHIYSEKAAYHGEIVFNPTTGAVLRVTAEAEQSQGQLVESAAMMVEYAPTQIRSKSVVLPVKSVSMLKAHTEPPPPGMHTAEFKGHPKTFLNEVEFKDYHEFRGEMRLVTDAEGAQASDKAHDASSTQVPTSEPKGGAQPPPGISESALPPEVPPSHSAPIVAQMAQPSTGQSNFQTADYEGTIGRSRVVLHVNMSNDGKASCALDLPDQEESGLSCSRTTLDGQKLTFAQADLQAKFQGEFDSTGIDLTGIWTREIEQTSVTLHRLDFRVSAQPSALDGEWHGNLEAPAGPIPVILHTVSDEAGNEHLALDSPSQNLFGMQADRLISSKNQVEFWLSRLGGHFKGELSSDRKLLMGTWHQRNTEMPLVLTRFRASRLPSRVDGDWQASMQTNVGPLRAQLQVVSDESGGKMVIFSSPDQDAWHIEGGEVSFNDPLFSFKLPSLHAAFSGRLSANGNSIDGQWAQEGSTPITFARAPAGSAGDRFRQADLPRPPLTLAAVHADLDQKLRPMVETAQFAGMPSVGIAIGLYARGESATYTYGVAKPDSLFEIGSVTETFTGLLLAQLVEAKKVSLNTPLRLLLPAGTASKPDGPELTLLDLATFHSGLSDLFKNSHPANPASPFAGFTDKDMYEFIRAHGVAKSPLAPQDANDSPIALLGDALSRATAKSYAELLQDQLLIPLHLRNTFIQVPESERGRLLDGHLNPNMRTRAGDFGIMTPASGLKSSIQDMLSYAVAQLKPPSEFSGAITTQHALNAKLDGGFQVGLCWAYEPATGNYFSYGHTPGYTSAIFFNPSKDVAVVVLVNLANERWAQNIGYRIQALLEGRRAFPIMR